MTKTLTQFEIENLSTEEYHAFLAYGDDIAFDQAHVNPDSVSSDAALQNFIVYSCSTSDVSGNSQCYK